MDVRICSVPFLLILICILILVIMPKQSNSIDPRIMAMFLRDSKKARESGDGTSSAEIVARFGLEVLRISASANANANNYSQFNFVFSPWTIVNNIGAVYKVTKGRTRSEIKRHLLRGLSDSKFFDDMHSCLTNLHKSKKKKKHFYDFRALSALFIDQRLIKPVKSIFESSLKSTFGCDVKTLDLRTKSRAVSKINKFIHLKTRRAFLGGGNDVIVAPPTMLNQLNPDWLNLVLANALYFKGNWSVGNQLTTMRSFTIDDHRRLTNIAALTLKGETFLYKKTSTMELVGLPYKGDNKLYLFVITPTTSDQRKIPLNNFVRYTLDYKQLLKNIQQAKQTAMEVHLPIFNITATFDAKPLLKIMGVNRLFDPGADLWSQVFKITGKTFVSNVVHAAHITIGQTPNYIDPSSNRYSYLKYQQWRADFINYQQQFHVDRPFLFALVDMSTKTMLLLGRVVHP